MPKQYSAPTVTTVGELHEVTLAVKAFDGTPDGTFLRVGRQNIPLADFVSA